MLGRTWRQDREYALQMMFSFGDLDFTHDSVQQAYKKLTFRILCGVPFLFSFPLFLSVEAAILHGVAQCTFHILLRRENMKRELFFGKVNL